MKLNVALPNRLRRCLATLVTSMKNLDASEVPMTTRSILMFTGLTAAALAALSLPLFAHEGHGKGEVAPYDLDTPRKVSPETAAHIGL